MNTPAKHRYRVLDSFRGICACMVVIYHFHTVGWISRLPLVRDSWLFVEFFFVLSGFVITTAFRARIAAGMSIGAFMWLRIGRIYPVHLFVTALFVAVQLALLARSGPGQAFQGTMSIPTLLASLTLTQTFFLPTGVVWNGPSWSIAVEMWTYLIFAALYRWCGSRASLAVVCALVAAASCSYIALFNHGDMDAFRYGAFCRCTYGFALGTIGAECYPAIRGRWGRGATALELGAIGLIVVFLSLVGATPFSMLAPPLFLGLILIFAHEGGAVSAALKTRFPLLLGELSYSIYMIHLFLLYRLSGFIAYTHRGRPQPFLICENVGTCSATGSPWLADALVVPVLAVVIGAAYLLRAYVEAPCERWTRNIWLRRMAAAPGRQEAAGASPIRGA